MKLMTYNKLVYEFYNEQKLWLQCASEQEVSQNFEETALINLLHLLYNWQSRTFFLSFETRM